MDVFIGFLILFGILVGGIGLAVLIGLFLIKILQG